MNLDRTFSVAAPYACVLIPFAAYMLTTAPLLLAGDAGELVVAMFSLGVPHPPGYPFFALTGKAVSLLPLGDIAFRGNFLSAVLVSLTALAAYGAMRELCVREMTAVFTGLAVAMAFSGPVWGIATEAEVYSGSLLLTVSAFYLLFRWNKGAGARYAYAASFIAGLSVCGHYSALVAIPGMVLLVSLDRGLTFRFVLGALFFFLLGLSTFLYVPLRAYTGPPINWGEADGAAAFLAHLSRASYGDLGAFKMGSLLASGAGGFGVSSPGVFVAAAVAAAVAVAAGLWFRRRGLPVVAVGVAAATVILLAKLAVNGFDEVRIGYAVSLMSSQAWWPVLVLATVGLYAVFMRDRNLSYALALAALSMAVVYVYRVPNDPRDYMLPVAEKFFAPLFALTTILAGAGVARVREFAEGLGERSGPAAGAVVASLPAVFGTALLLANFPAQDRSRVYWPHDYSVDMMRTFEQDAVFMSEGDHHPFFSIYQQVIEKARPDVRVLEVNGIIFDGYEKLDPLARVRRISSVFCSQEAELNPFPGVLVEQTGVLNRWVQNYGEAGDPVRYYVFRGDREKAAGSGYMNRSIYANYNYHMGRRLFNMKRDEEARKYLYEALRAGGIFPWVQMNVGNIERYWGMDAVAIERYEKVTEIAPARYEAYLNIGDIYMEKGRLDRAEEAYLSATRSGAGAIDPEPYMQLALIYEARGMKDRAAGYWREYQSRPGSDAGLAGERIRSLKR